MSLATLRSEKFRLLKKVQEIERAMDQYRWGDSPERIKAEIQRDVDLVIQNYAARFQRIMDIPVDSRTDSDVASMSQDIEGDSRSCI